MALHILLDSYPLGALTSPNPVVGIYEWVKNCELTGHKIYIPEVIDYELRRELIRARKSNSIARLDRLKTALQFIPITSAAMLLAAELWATSRQTGFSTGDPKKLDIDVILAAQALTLGVPQNSLIIATSNVSHIARYAPAEIWSNITP